MNFKPLLLWGFILISSSCMSIMGYKDISKMTKNEIIEKNYFFQKDSCFLYLNENFHNSKGHFFEKLDSVERKNFYQPIQAFYFNDKNMLSSYFINCNAPGFSKLNWDNDNQFSTYPPSTQTKPINLSIDDFVEFISLINCNDFNFTNNDIYVVWSNMFYRQSIDLIELINKNKPNETKVWLVNYDYIEVK